MIYSQLTWLLPLSGLLFFAYPNNFHRVLCSRVILKQFNLSSTFCAKLELFLPAPACAKSSHYKLDLLEPFLSSSRVLSWLAAFFFWFVSRFYRSFPLLHSQIAIVIGVIVVVIVVDVLLWSLLALFFFYYSECPSLPRTRLHINCGHNFASFFFFDTLKHELSSNNATTTRATKLKMFFSFVLLLLHRALDLFFGCVLCK